MRWPTSRRVRSLPGQLISGEVSRVRFRSITLPVVILPGQISKLLAGICEIMLQVIKKAMPIRYHVNRLTKERHTTVEPPNLCTMYTLPDTLCGIKTIGTCAVRTFIKRATIIKLTHIYTKVSNNNQCYYLLKYPRSQMKLW